MDIQIKFDSEDPPIQLLYKMMEDINECLPKQNQLYQPEIRGKYILFSMTNTIEELPSPTIYVSGLVSGYLIANDIEVI